MDYFIGLIAGTTWLVIMVCTLSPETVGEWKASRDISYQIHMDAYYGQTPDDLYAN
jgi:hypothetical protein